MDGVVWLQWCILLLLSVFTPPFSWGWINICHTTWWVFFPFNWKKTRVCPSCVRTCRWLMLSSLKKFNLLYPYNSGLPRWQSGKESACQCKRCKKCGFDLWVGNIPRKWQPTPVFMLGKFHGQRNQVGYSPWDHKEWDMTKVTEHTHMPMCMNGVGSHALFQRICPTQGSNLGLLSLLRWQASFFCFFFFYHSCHLGNSCLPYNSA